MFSMGYEDRRFLRNATLLSTSLALVCGVALSTSDGPEAAEAARDAGLKITAYAPSKLLRGTWQTDRGPLTFEIDRRDGHRIRAFSRGVSVYEQHTVGLAEIRRLDVDGFDALATKARDTPTTLEAEYLSSCRARGQMCHIDVLDALRALLERHPRTFLEMNAELGIVGVHEIDPELVISELVEARTS